MSHYHPRSGDTVKQLPRVASDVYDFEALQPSSPMRRLSSTLARVHELQRALLFHFVLVSLLAVPAAVLVLNRVGIAEHRLILSVALSAVSITALLHMIPRGFESRQKPGLEALLLAVALGVATFFPLLTSNTVTIAILILFPLLVSVVFSLRAQPHAPLQSFTHVLGSCGRFLGDFLFHPSPRTDNDLTTRRVAYLLFAIPLALTLTVSLSLFMPWEFFSDRSLLEPSHVSDAWLLGPFSVEANRGGTILLAILLYVALPLWVFAAVICPAIHSGPDTMKKPNPWDELVRSVRENDQPEETDASGGTFLPAAHLYLGTVQGVEPPIPALLHQPILNEHCFVGGRTGGGKTSLAIMPLLIQILRGYRGAEQAGRGEEKPPTLIIDLKGDPALYNVAKKEAKGRFRYFTLGPNETQLFNPFESLADRDDHQVAQILASALSIDSGAGYGSDYYSGQCRAAILMAFQKHQPRNVREMHEALEKVVPNIRDSGHALSSFFSLRHYKQLHDEEYYALEQDADGNPERINMHAAIRNGDVLYFHLPASIDHRSAAEVGRLALFSFFNAAESLYHERGCKPRSAYVVLDEFQEMVAQQLRRLLVQSRSFGLNFILSAQTLSSLKTKDSDLRSDVVENCRVRWLFSVQQPREIEDLMFLSGEESTIDKSWGWQTRSGIGWGAQSGGGRTVSGSQMIGYSTSFSPRLQTRIGVNELLAMNDTMPDSVLLVTGGSGYTRFRGLPVMIRSPWPMPKREYDRLAGLGFPKPRRQETPEPPPNPKKIRALRKKKLEKQFPDQRKLFDEVDDE